MKLKIANRTKSTIVLNKLNAVLAGDATQIFEVTSSEQRAELDVLDRANVLEIIELVPVPKISSVVSSTRETTTPAQVSQPKNKGGRPKGSKNKPKVASAQNEQARATAAEAQTQLEGGRVVIATGKDPIETKMRKGYTNDMPESEATRESIEAMEQLEREEREEDTNPPPVDESKLDPSEQSGRTAIVIKEGTHQKVDLTNSAVNKGVKGRDAFIDREENAQKEALRRKQSSPMIDDKDDKEHSDAFIE